MWIRKFDECPEFIAGDHTVLREFLNANKDNVNLRYSLAHATLKPGKTSTPHKLKTSEVYYILEGEGVMHINDETEHAGAGDTIYIPPHSKQYIESVGDTDLKFLCIVDPAWKPEDEEVL